MRKEYADKGLDVKRLESECICAECPSFVDCEEPIAYCVVGVSKCIKTEQGCICPGCPVYEELQLDSYYYCIR